MNSRLTTILLILSFLVSCRQKKHKSEMQEYLFKTRDIQAEGNFQEALMRYVWYHEHALEYDRAVYGVRLSFALSYWKELADVYPPALVALKQMRDNKTKILIEKDISRELSLDRELFAD